MPPVPEAALLRAAAAAGVPVPAVVLDKKGRPVHGLKAENFHLQENLIPQKIDFFNVNQDERISIAFNATTSSVIRARRVIARSQLL